MRICVTTIIRAWAVKQSRVVSKHTFEVIHSPFSYLWQLSTNLTNPLPSFTGFRSMRHFSRHELTHPPLWIVKLIDTASLIGFHVSAIVGGDCLIHSHLVQKEAQGRGSGQNHQCTRDGDNLKHGSSFSFPSF